MTTIIFVKIEPFSKWTITFLFPSSDVLQNMSKINKQEFFTTKLKEFLCPVFTLKSLIKGSLSRVSLNKIQKPDGKWGSPIDIWGQSNEVKRRSKYQSILVCHCTENNYWKVDTLPIQLTATGRLIKGTNNATGQCLNRFPFLYARFIKHTNTATGHIPFRFPSRYTSMISSVVLNQWRFAK